MSKVVEVVITAKHKVNHDSYIYSFQFSTEKILFQIGQHFRILQNLKTFDHPEGEDLVRKYTPINPCSRTDTIDFLVKIYRPNVHPQFPNGGKYTPYLETQNVGDKLTIEGPFGRFDYKGHGVTILDEKQYTFKRIFFIAGGSGITPIFQVLMELATNKDEQIEIILLFANKTEEDIVLRKQLQGLGNRITLHYILDQPPAQWTHFTGYVNHQMIKSICPLDDPNTLYAHCGPAPMNQFLRTLFDEKYPQSVLFKF